MIKKALRFIEIDFNYLIFVKLPLIQKLKNIFFADFYILFNILFQKKSNYPKVKFNSTKISYDTPFATKTFLTAVYDFYLETNKLNIFPKSPVVIDIGANIGQYLFAIKSFFPNAKVYSFEPDPNIFNLLKENSKELNNVNLFNYALSEKNGFADFFVSSEFSEWSSLVEVGQNNKKIKIKTVKGDSISFSKDHPIDLIKIDVEGAELNVVKGLLKTLTSSKYLLIEISLNRSSLDIGSSELIKLLFENGFYIHTIGRIFSAGLGEEQGAVDILFRNKRF